MKHLLLTTLAVAFSWLGFAQSLQEVNANISFEPTQYHYSDNFRTSSCGPDTVGYAYAKAAGLQSFNINNATSASAVAQYFDCPQDITIKGTDFYAWSTSGVTVDVSVYLYVSGPDSIPTGFPLDSAIVSVDTAFGAGTLNVIRKTAVFPTNPTVNQPYCLVFGNYSANAVAMVFNDYNQNDGAQEWLCSVDLFGTWTRGYGVNIGGVPLDADFIAEPHIEYDLTAAFTQDVTCASDSGNLLNWTNTSSPILWNRMYSQAAFQGSNNLQSTWSFGDGSPLGNAIDTSHTYHTTGPWTVSLTDTLFGWRTTCTDFTSMGTASDPSCCTDTLLFEDFQTQLIPASWGNVDLDGNTDNNGRAMDWYTTVDLETTLPGDTNFVAAASSWFNPADTANNLLTLDPVTVCDADMQLIWKSAPFEGPSFADGYGVRIQVSGDTAITEVARLAEDIGGGAGTWGPGWQHTNWNGNRGVLQEWTLPLAAYNGQTITISFLHDSNDDNLILLDDIFVGLCNAPVAAFSDSVIGLGVGFFDESTMTPTSWFWDFGDGNTSTLQNPTHVYAAAGTYTTCLTATNSCGSDSSCASVTVAPCAEAAPAITGFTNVSYHGTTVNWSSATLAPLSKFVVRYHEFGNSPNFSYKVVSNTSATSAYVNGLDPATQYVFRVGAKCATQTQASFSDTSSVWTKNLCPQPTGMAYFIVDTITYSEATVYWDDMGADSYKVKLRPVGGAWEYRNTTSISATFDTEPGMQYEWKVRSLCNTGGNRPYGPTQQFSTPIPRLATQTGKVLSSYPNPTTNDVNLQVEMDEEDQLRIRLMDVTGKVLIDRSVSANVGINTMTIEISEFSQGIYTLNVENEAGLNLITEKIIKQ